MIRSFILLIFVLLTASCATKSGPGQRTNDNSSFTIAFGSCNKHDLENYLWDDIIAEAPDLWIWGGDNIYADTDSLEKMKAMYQQQNKVKGYRHLKKKIPVIGTWDDHDYGLNDGGEEFSFKKESQQVFLDFMNVPKDSPRRQREGIYNSHLYNFPQGSVKILVLDTRYFRTPLSRDTLTKKRFQPNTYGEGTLLGALQWQWLKEELMNSEANFNIIVSSIQFLSNEHGFECWGNFPHEVVRLQNLISESKAKGVIILSGDRHISEFSSQELEGLSYPLIDFTSSGLTHAYRDYSGEPNPFRRGEVIATESFGLVKLDFKTRRANFQILGDNATLLGEIQQQY